MNFDNLVEDAEKHGAELLYPMDKEFIISISQLQALILEYIERDRAQGMKPAAIVSIIDDNKETSDLLDRELPTGTILFTHAQPAPAQIAEPEKPDHVLQAFWDRALAGYRFVNAAKLRKGEPL